MIEKFAVVGAACISHAPFTPPSGPVIPADTAIWANSASIARTGAGVYTLTLGLPSAPSPVGIESAFPQVAFMDGTSKLTWNASPNAGPAPEAGTVWTFQFFNAVNALTDPDGPFALMMMSIGDPGTNV